MLEKNFVTGENPNPNEELSEEEKMEIELKRKFSKFSKKGWVQKIMKKEGISFDEWLEEKVADEMEKMEEVRKNINTNED
jgi:hypothetical protein